MARVWYNGSDTSNQVPERSTQCLPIVIIPAFIAGVNRELPRTFLKTGRAAVLFLACLHWQGFHIVILRVGMILAVHIITR